MKACPTCGRLYPADAAFCPVDGAALSSATQVPVQTTGDDPRVGQLLFERYQIRRVVADGGMGRVYEALDMQERRSVAVKILHAEVARDPVQLERFRREFEVSKLLPHEHIIDVLDFRETSDGSFALIMEFLYGEELRGTLDREQGLTAARIVRMVSQVARGLDEAHSRKFVHRDLKPDNLFLCQTADGDIVKILDFGSVKDKTEGAKKLTVMGTTIGSPYYMSPEQAQGLDTLDQRADVWSLAAILFECLTGTVPFQGKNGPMILLEILTKEAPGLSTRASAARHPIPRTLDPVFARAFKKSAALRYESVGAFADAIGAAYGLSGTHAEWALRSERELSAAIDEKLPELLTVEVAPEKRTVADDFFGEGDALGESLGGAAPPRGNPEPPSVDGPAGGRRDAMAEAMHSANAGLEDLPPLPASRSPLPWVLLVGGVVLLGLALLLVL